MLKNQEKKDNLIKELETKLASFNNVNKTELINMVKKSALLTKQYEKLVVKNKFGYDIYAIIESFVLQKQYDKVYKNQSLVYQQFRIKNSGISTGYTAYHYPELFFVVYLTYVNMSILDEKYFELIPEMMDQGILKYIFLTSSYQIPKIFPKKLKTILDYLFQAEHFVNLSFEIILPLLKTYGTIVFTYHHVYIKHNKEPLVPQQKLQWEMTRRDEFSSYFCRYRDFQNFDFRNTRNNFFLSY